MEKKEFKCEYSLDLEKYNEFLKGFSSTNILTKVFRTLVILCFSFYFLESFIVTKNYMSIIFYVIILAFIMGIFYNNRKNGNVQYKRMLNMNNGKPAHNSIIIDEDGIHTINIDTENKSEYKFEQLISVIETKNLFILMMKYRIGLVIDKSTLTGGSDEEFVNFIFENSKNINRKKVKKAHTSNVMSIVVNVVLAIILCMAIIFEYKQHNKTENYYGNINYDEGFINMDNNEMSYQELANILEELGITDISSIIINQLENEWKEYPEEIMIDKMATLLSRIGYGKYNYTTGEWKPTSNKVYSFDMECYDIDNMYQLLFEGISAIGNEELKFSNVSVDTSKVDYDRGIGTQIIKFDLNGKTYTFEADYYNDWYDIQILDFLNEILKNENSPKQLYFMGDGYQDFIVFYCDKEWANTFGEKTDCKLTTKAE